MDLLPLDHQTYYPRMIFEGYASLIWTERFGVPGEFQIKSSRVEETVNTLTLGSLVSLRDTTEVMMVETHSIEPNSSDGTPEITVSGRSLDSFLENRVLIPETHGEDWNMLQSYTPQHMLSLLIWNAMVNDSGQDPTKAWVDGDISQIDPYCAADNVVVSLGPIQFAETLNWALSMGVVSDVVQNIQRSYKMGIRTIRPLSARNRTYDKISFDITELGAVRGRPIIESITDDTQNMRFEVYQGLDRTVDQTKETPVILSSSLGHIVEPKYLKSIKTAKTYAAISSEWGYIQLPEDTDGSGFFRRVLLYDGGDSEFQNILKFGAMELQKNKVVVMADGEISPTSPYQYGRDYFLGDTITFSGEYESNTPMFVNEIVRTSDINGETISPGIMNHSEIEDWGGSGGAG